MLSCAWQQSIKRDVEDLKESLNANETDKKTTAERIQKLEDNTKSSLAALQKENDKLRANFKLIEDKNLGVCQGCPLSP